MGGGARGGEQSATRCQRDQRYAVGVQGEGKKRRHTSSLTPIHTTCTHLLMYLQCPRGAEHLGASCMRAGQAGLVPSVRILVALQSRDVMEPLAALVAPEPALRVGQVGVLVSTQGRGPVEATATTATAEPATPVAVAGAATAFNRDGASAVAVTTANVATSIGASTGMRPLTATNTT